IQNWRKNNWENSAYKRRIVRKIHRKPKSPRRIFRKIEIGSLWRRPRTTTADGNGKCPHDLKREAAAAWRRFVSCVRLLPADQAAPLWQAALAEAAALTHSDQYRLARI